MNADRPTIDSESFLTALLERGVVSDAKVTGTVQLRSLGRSGQDRQQPAEHAETTAAPSYGHAGYRVVNVSFDDPFVCDAARFDAHLVFERCRFDGGFSARGTRMEAGLELLRSTFLAPEEAFAVCLDGARIEGDLHFRGNRVEGYIGARRMHVSGDLLFTGLKVVARGTRIPEVDYFYRSPFGELEQDFEAIRKDLGAHGASLLNLRGSKVDGTLYLGGLPYEESTGLVDPYEFEEDHPELPMLSVIGGGVDGADTQVGHDVRLWNMRIIGDLDLSGAKVGRAIRGQTIVRRNPEPIACRLEVAGKIRLQQAEIGTDLALDGALIRDDVVCALCKISGVLSGGSVCIERDRWKSLEIGGRLQLTSSDIAFVALRAAQIRQGLVMITGHLQRFYLGPQMRAVGRSASDDHEDCAGASGSGGAGAYRLRYERCRLRSIELQSIRVEEDLTLAGVDLRAWGRPGLTALQFADRSIRVNNCTVGGRFSLGTDGVTQTIVEQGDRGDNPAHRYRSLLGGTRGIDRKDVEDCDRLLPEPGSANVDLGDCRARWSALDASCPAEIPGRVELSHNKVDGEFDISHLNVHGDIRLDDVTVGRDLRASRFGSGRNDGEGTEPIYGTRCSSFSMQNLHCEGDVDLTGIILRAGDSVDAKRPDRHRVHAPYASVKGDLLIWSKYHEVPKGRESGDALAGADLRAVGVVLDLQGAEIGRLLVSGANFAEVDAASADRPEPETAPGAQARLNLENATIGRFEIKQPVPAKIKLSGISVVKWDLKPDETYLKVLSSTREFFSGDVYSQVEKSLRNEGKDALADDVHIQMRRELEARMWIERMRARWLLSRTHRFLTNYGTSALMPFLWIVAIVAVNATLFSIPDNVVASTGYVGVMAEKDRDSARAAARRVLESRGERKLPVVVDLTPGDLGYDWSFGDVLSMTARFSVPLITVAVSEAWDPAGRSAVVPCIPRPASAAESPCTIPIRVVTITRWLGYLSWVFWPLFIIRVSGFINRRDR